jgi:hypothetical protein
LTEVQKAEYQEKSKTNNLATIHEEAENGNFERQQKEEEQLTRPTDLQVIASDNERLEDCSNAIIE